MRYPALPVPLLAPPARASGRLAWAVSCALMIAVVAGADYWTGYEISLFVLYLVPVFVATWIFGLWPGIVTGLAATLVWYLMFAPDNPLPHPFNHVWDAGIRAATTAVFAVLIHHLQRALARSDERFVTVLEGLNAAVYVADDRSGELVYVNEQCRKAFGPQPLRRLAEIERRFDGGIAARERDHAGETQREAHDAQSARWYLVDVRPMRWVDGRDVTLNVATDITLHQQAEQLAREQRRKLETTSRLIAAGEMAATLAHELNHPLASVVNYNTGCLALLDAGTYDAAELRDGLEKSSEQAERAGFIIRQVRELIRTREPNLVRCAAADVVENTMRLLEDEAARASTAIRTELAANLPPVLADPVMLQALVLNLVRNAIEAMLEADAAQREVVIRSSQTEGELRLEVEDRGAGLPEALRQELFTPFFSTKPGGMGLGLQICRSIAELHEGRLWASPREGGGTVFHFSLPVRAA